MEQRTKNRSECPQGLTGGGDSQAQLTWLAPKVWASLLGTRRRAAPSRQSTHRLESRMRENRLSGLEGGVACIAPSLPLSREAEGERSPARSTCEYEGEA